MNRATVRMDPRARRFSELTVQLARFRRPSNGRAAVQLTLTLTCFLSLWILAYRSLEVSYLATLLLWIPTGGFLLRLFLIQHDCGHGSFFTSRAANDATGFLLGVLTLTPYHQWRRNHALHHANVGNLDRRGHGDIRLLTVTEYVRLAPFHRRCYRVLRNPVFLFVVAPIFHFTVLQRFPYYSSWSWKKSHLDDARQWACERRGVHATNALIVATALLIGRALGFGTVLVVHLPAAVLAASAGMWLFHVQHGFEGARWTRQADWDYVSASTLGSSYYKLPRVLQWLTANIGLHHIHHLDSRIPNYRLQASLVEFPELQDVPALTLRASVRCASLSLWDEQEDRFMRFRDVTR